MALGGHNQQWYVPPGERGGGMTSGVNVPEGPQVGDSTRTQDGPKPERSPHAEESPQTGDIRQTQERTEPSAGERRGRLGRVVISLVAGALLLLAFSPVSRLAADGLPRAPGNSVAVVTGRQQGNTATIQVVPAGLPKDARIRTAADVFPYAVAALGEQDALALMGLLNSKSLLAGTITAGNTGNPYGVGYPYQYRPLEAVLDNAPPASFASGATALGAAL